MKKVLVIEDSKVLSNRLKRMIEHETGLTVDLVESYGATVEAIAIEDYFVAVTDLNLPDATKGATIDILTEKHIPTIAYTGDYSDELRDNMWKKRIVDYVLKKDPDSIKYISRLICQLHKNTNISVLVVDDSIVLRNSMKRLLETHLFDVDICGNANEALEKIETMQNLKLVISDYMMPDMDGFDFVRQVRRKFKKEELAFIGVSGSQSEQISAKFIKYGANDFMMKPFSHEQFYTRVTQNLQTLLMIQHIKDLSFKDYLTGLYNRRYFFEEMETIYKPDSDKTVAMLDIDFFKKVNDTYGHDGGDIVLKEISTMIKDYVGADGFVSRFGGEEFCLYLYSLKDKEYFEILRRKIEDLDIAFESEIIKVTSSFGVTSKAGISIDSMINLADYLLYTAKTSGRNTVCF